VEVTPERALDSKSYSVQRYLRRLAGRWPELKVQELFKDWVVHSKTPAQFEDLLRQEYGKEKTKCDPQMQLFV
jgi:hypothetical protein